MASEPPPRSRAARTAAETALLRIVLHYGQRPEFVVLGGLVPELLCTESTLQHAGTTDVDVQVDLEIACGAVNAVRLEGALRDAGFVPEGGRSWRWVAGKTSDAAVVKFELLADLHGEPAEATVVFDACENLGALNLRGTGFAAHDMTVRELSARIEGIDRSAKVNVSGLAGFLLAKAAAAHSRRQAKDWYDIAFVLLHNDAGGPAAAAERVRDRFAGELNAVATALRDLQANFETPGAQGPQAYVRQMRIDHPGLDPSAFAADAVLAVQEFHRGLQHRVD